MQCICIDLKSFYASVECVDRGLDPMDTNLVVADESRTEKNDMSCCYAVTEKIWYSGKSEIIRGHTKGSKCQQRAIEIQTV